ncbi:MAG TPA: D-alanyl-D-alanine carboxypeptidase/D-alanyl-D-alanine-endopeptidase [Parachlamydiaceae bacterium]|nr:D-alanyl-D-alanine carboxypeptidase/D-alanyl-D-alanine-endopeptidase [Parachlamydiaceae bacterium]
MKKQLRFLIIGALSFLSPLNGVSKELPEKIVQIMQQPRYKHSFWGIYVKDSGLELNADRFFLPASTTKLFSTAALVNAYGNDYRFKTPVFSFGELQNGKLEGNLVLVGQGDLTFGGRQEDSDTIAFTSMDHIIANDVPGAILTPQDPLYGLKSLAKEIREKGIQEINGDILIDTRLFETIEKRGMILSPVLLNENLIDFTFDPTKEKELASFEIRPLVSGYTFENQVVTVAKGEKLEITLEADATGKKITAKGKIPLDEKNIVRVFLVQNPAAFVKAAFIDALKAEGIAVHEKNSGKLPPLNAYQRKEPVALFVSPPLSEYVKLILKVSHNLGADLVPLLLAAKQNQTTFDEGMKLLGNFVVDKVRVSKDSFLFVDAAGADANRLTLQAEIALLNYIQSLPKEDFQKFYDALPILGVDGSLQDFGKKTGAVNKVRAKTGTGIALNFSTQEFFLTTQALSGYLENKDGRPIPFMAVVNNANMPTMEDIFIIFEDLAEVAGALHQSLN